MRHIGQWVWAGFLTLGALTASAQSVWSVRNAAIPTKTIQSVTWTGSQLVAVGNDGVIMTSSSGSGWTERTSNTTKTLNAVASGNGKIVAIGNENTVTVSSDGGATWSAGNFGQTASISAYGMTWSGSRFVAVGSGGMIITSADGVTWVRSAASTTGTIGYNSVTSNGSRLFAVGQSGVARSSDDHGVTWDVRNVGAGTNNALYVVAWAMGQFVIASPSGGIYTSADGISWSNRNIVLATAPRAIAGSNTQIVLVGDGGKILSSSDGGAVWTDRPSGLASTAHLNAITWANGQAVAMGVSGAVRVSSNGVDWTNPAVSTVALNGVAWAPGKPYLVVGAGGTVLSSTNGSNWTLQSNPQTFILTGATWSGDTAIAVGANGRAVVSVNGAAWTEVTTGLPSSNTVLNSVATGGGVTVAVGSPNIIITSHNGGQSWTPRASTVTGTPTFYSVAYIGSVFVAVGSGGTIAISSDGVSWSQRPSGLSNNPTLYSVARNGNQGLVVGASGSILTSGADGMNWTKQTPPSSTTSLFGAASAGGASQVAVGSAGLIWASANSVAWSTQNSGISAAFNAIAASDTLYVAVGASGTILTSPRVSVPPAPTLLSPADAATNVPVSPALTWNAAAGATGYRLQIARDAAFTTGVVNDSTSGTGLTAATLLGNTQYYWRVSARNALGASAYSSARSFTTGAVPTAPPATPTLSTPGQFAPGIPTTTALTWNPSAGASSYFVQVSRMPNNFTSSALIVSDSLVSGTTRAVSGMAGGTEYYWRVRAKNSLGSSDWSLVWSFTTQLAAPSVPVLVSPEQFAEGLGRGLMLTWEASSNAVSYQVQVATATSFAAGVLTVDDTTTALTRSAGTLKSNVRYYWRVRAKNALGYSAYSDVNTFVTGTVALTPREVLALHRVQAAGTESLRFNLPSAESVTLRAYGLDGALLATVVNERLPAGGHNVRLPEGLHGTLYLLEFKAGSYRALLKIHP